MKDDTYNPNDPEFLASRAPDERLIEKEQATLDRALAESPDLRAEVQRLAGVSGLITRWAAESAEIDWETHAKLIHADVVNTLDPDAEKLENVDGLVSTWGNRRVELDEEAFTASVLDRIAPKASHRSRSLSGMIFRIATPLAAAAVIVLAVSVQFFSPASPSAVSIVAIGRHARMQEDVQVLADAPRTVVSYARVTTPESVASTPRSSFRFMSIQVSPQVEAAGDAWPL